MAIWRDFYIQLALPVNNIQPIWNKQTNKQAKNECFTRLPVPRSRLAQMYILTYMTTYPSKTLVLLGE